MLILCSLIRYSGLVSCIVIVYTSLSTNMTLYIIDSVYRSVCLFDTYLPLANLIIILNNLYYSLCKNYMHCETRLFTVVLVHGWLIDTGELSRTF